MTIIHIVSLAFKANTPPEKIKDICAIFLELKNKCVHPTTQSVYIKSARGGVDNSPEGLQNGFTHVFVLEFQNDQDREYYLTEDPAHLSLVAILKATTERVQVIDFVDGVF